MKLRRAVLMLIAAVIAASCSEKPVAHPEKDAPEASGELVRDSDVKSPKSGAEQQPRERKVAQDCVAFVRSTKVVPLEAAKTDCPECPRGGTEVFSFRQMKTDAVSCSGDACTFAVTIRAVFNPGSGETIAGGLAAWIPPEQRSAYLNGETPAGDQLYRVQIIYKRRGDAWRAVEFARPPGE